MKALITGGAGFIGSHIAQALCQRGAKVIVLDDLSLGQKHNLAWATESKADLEFVQGEVTNEPLINQLVAGCDWVFHEAAMPSVPRSVQDPLGSNFHNTDGTLRMLVAARDAKVKRFLFASSSAIYGDVDAPSKHEQLPPSPLSPYALQKYTGERYCQLFHSLYGLPTVALRYFNVYGPRQAFDSPYSGVIAKFCTAMLKGEAPVIYGDGLQSRDFTYIENVVQANLMAAAAPAEKVAGGVFNAATGHSINLLDLVRDINDLTGQSLKPRFEPGRIGDVKSSLANNSAAEKAFGYKATVTWKEGLSKTLDFYRSQK
jgi:nucleoside-diphosphate-sugar epimerase